MSELIDNSKDRVQDLADIVRELHEGADPRQVKQRLASIVRSTTSEEIVAMEQRLLAQGTTVEQIKGMCDLHSQVVADLLQERSEAVLTPGHPAHTFRLENEAIGRAANEMRDLLAGLTAPAGAGTDPTAAADASLLPRWRELLERLLEVEKHYARKEHLLFSCLERHGVTGPSQVMWGKDDDVRALLKGLREALALPVHLLDELRLIARRLALPVLDQVEEMIRKEQNILLPMSLKTLAPEEWAEIWRESPRFGFCLVEPGDEWRPADAAGRPDEAVAAGALAAGSIPLGVGRLTVAQLRGLLGALPVDLTFVDADDRVAFFSEGDRIFQRTPAIIGRLVQNCHPPQSVAVVQRILDDFRSGRQSVAEFWIELHGRFVHIRYLAVRDEQGEYQGTLEVTQDLAPLRALTGERRLLQYATDTAP